VCGPVAGHISRVLCKTAHRAVATAVSDPLLLQIVHVEPVIDDAVASADQADNWNGIRLASPQAQRGICPRRAQPAHNRRAWLAGYAGILFRPSDRGLVTSLFQDPRAYVLLLFPFVSLAAHSRGHFPAHVPDLN